MYWQRRLTRLESALYAALIGTVLALFAERALYYMELAERAAMESTVINLNSALRIAMAYDPYTTGIASARAGANPLRLLRVQVSNDAGELPAAGLVGVERGNWVFDPRRGELVYLPRFRRHLQTADPDAAVRFRLERKIPGNGLLLVAATAYEWR